MDKQWKSQPTTQGQVMVYAESGIVAASVAPENAERIVRAVNAHEALCAVLRELSTVDLEVEERKVLKALVAAAHRALGWPE